MLILQLEMAPPICAPGLIAADTGTRAGQLGNQRQGGEQKARTAAQTADHNRFSRLATFILRGIKYFNVS